MNKLRTFFVENKDFLIIQTPLLFFLGVVLGYFSRSFYFSINNFSPNETDIITAIVGALGTIAAASLGIWMAFTQIKKQFEHKVIHDAWVDFQKHLFDFSSSQSEFDSKVLGLTYFVNSYTNSLVNKGNLQKYRSDAWA